MYTKSKRRGFTLVELLIVIVVIGVLAAMMIMSSTEAVTTAKASNIITNLQILKRAVLAWYMDNLDKVISTKTGNFVAGMVTINGKTSPIQEWKDNDLHLSRYLSHLGGSGVNSNTKYTFINASGKEQTNTDLAPGYYGVCDGGGKAGKRHIWYVGYRFTSDETAVREKILLRLKSAGLMMGTADAHPDKDGDNAAAVWLQVLDMS